MSMAGPVAARLGKGDRLHLQHGPIDLIIGADAVRDGGRDRAFAAASRHFDGLLEGLVSELSPLRERMHPDMAEPDGPVARRMHAACLPLCAGTFVTRMVAVAGAVADEILSAMTAAEPLRRAYVNDGGDIAIHLSDGARFKTAMAQVDGRDLGRISIAQTDGIGGMATSGAGGRSQSFGIADSVTVLARSAADADVAATLIANAIDIPDHPAILRVPASDVQPDSDLGDRLVVDQVGPLAGVDIQCALSSGAELAQAMLRQNTIAGAALFLRGEKTLIGGHFGQASQFEKVEHV